MPPELISLSGLVLMFALGLRHGLDPDHIACIDGLTWRALEGDHRRAIWVGTLFAVGHGLLVTAMAVGVSLLAPSLSLSPRVIELLEWIPTALLILVGTLNLRQLLRGDPASTAPGWKLRLIPQRLSRNNSPWAVIATGALFAAVFDTATQASAWGYVASHQGGGWPAALTAGGVFTAGMVITDTIDGRLVCRVGRLGTRHPEAGRRLRRRLGWMVVAMSFGVAAYRIAGSVLPGLATGDAASALLGLSMVATVLVLGLWPRSGIMLAPTANR